MSTISEIEMLSDRVVGQSVRIAELEQQLADADTLAERLRVTAIEVLDAAGASDIERLRLSVPMVKLQAHLAAALSRPRVDAGTAVAQGIAPQEQAAIESAYVDGTSRGGKVIDLGTRIKRRSQFYDVAPSPSPSLRTSATTTDTEKE